MKVGGTAGTVKSRKQTYIVPALGGEPEQANFVPLGNERFFLRKNMAIYTKTGDRGKTSLFTGERVYKDSLRTDAYGIIDELNASIGVSISFIKNKKIIKLLLEIQNTLFYIGSYLAGNTSLVNEANLEGKTKNLEEKIDEMTEKMPKLKNFILPGGGKSGSSLHLARTVARRAERKLISLSKKEELNPEVMKYVNRLSDFLFTTARFANHLEKRKDFVWKR